MKKILDACCGGKMFWFDKHNPMTEYMDNREFSGTLCDGRKFTVRPDILGDFRNMPFLDETYKLVIFDPPHLLKSGETSWLSKKYGKLNADTWETDIKRGFEECFRVLQTDGVLVFKWNETDIKLSEIIKLATYKPLIGHRSGKRNNTHWILFMKSDQLRKAVRDE